MIFFLFYFILNMTTVRRAQNLHFCFFRLQDMFPKLLFLSRFLNCNLAECLVWSNGFFFSERPFSLWWDTTGFTVDDECLYKVFSYCSGHFEYILPPLFSPKRNFFFSPNIGYYIHTFTLTWQHNYSNCSWFLSSVS